MENTNIKEYIINNFKEDDINTLKSAIEQSIEENDEVVLPGLGVFLSLIWEGSTDELKKSMLNTLFEQLRKK